MYTYFHRNGKVNSIGTRLILCGLALTVAVFVSGPSFAATDWYFTMSAGGDWDQSFNWADSDGNLPPEGQPGAGDSALLVVPYWFNDYPDWVQPVHVFYRSDTSPLLNQVIVESGNVLMQWQWPDSELPTDEQLNLRSNVERVGGSGLTFDLPTSDFGGTETFPMGSHIQNAGTNSIANELVVGGTEGSEGLYRLEGTGVLSVGGFLYLGDAGAGRFEQNGGEHSVGTALFMGYAESGDGTYRMTDGSLTVVGGESVGGAGTGLFEQIGGTNSTGDLFVGQGATGSGAYRLGGFSTLNVLGTTTVGGRGQGEFEQSAGTHNACNMVIGAEVGGVGTYDLNGGILDTGTETIGDGGRGRFNQYGGEHLVGSLVLGAQDSGLTAVYNLDGGTLDVAQTTTVGADGDALFYQLSGTSFTTTDLKIAEGSTSESFYQMSGETLRITDDLMIGSLGKGDFYHYAGDVEIGEDIHGSLIIGSLNDSYQLSVGSLTVHGHEDISGTFIQRSDSSHTVTTGTVFRANGINIGTASGGSGEYQMIGGTLSTPYLVIGSGGSAQGSFVQTGPTSIVTTTYLNVGASQPESGLSNNYHLVDGLLLVGSGLDPGEVNVGLNAGDDIPDNIQLDGGKLWVIGDEKIGSGGWGLLGQTAGVHQVDGTLNVGHESVGYYVQSGGNLTVNGIENIGHSAEGYFFQNDGDHTINSGALIIGATSDGVGSYNLGEVSGTAVPTLTVNGVERIGNYGEGDFYHYRGTHTVNGELIVGVEASGKGSYTQTGGSLIVNDKETISYLGTGTFNQSGGTHNVDGVLYVGGNDVSGASSNGTGTYNLSGDGELNASSLQLGYGKHSNGTFSQSNGTATFSSLNAAGAYNSPLGGDATIHLDGGELIVNGTENIGYHGIATVNHSGGSNTANTFNLGYAKGADAEYTLTGTGELHTRSMNINDLGDYTVASEWGHGTFIQNGGDTLVEVEGTLQINPQMTGFGYPSSSYYSYKLEGGRLVNNGVQLAGSPAGYAAFQYGEEYSTTTWLRTVFAQSGGEHVVNGTLDIGAGGTTQNGLVRRWGRGAMYSLTSGTLSATEIHIHKDTKWFVNDLFSNKASFDIYSEEAVTISTTGSTFLNEGLTTFGGPAGATVNGRVENRDVMTMTNTSVDFNGNFINSGEFHSQSSNVQFDQLIVEATGYMTGNSEDMFSISGDFMNGSLENTLWNTADTSLIFNGSGLQNFYLAGIDMGATALGYENNFSWGELFIGSGIDLTLLDGNADEGAGLYIGLLGFEEPILDIGELLFGSIFSDFNVYYNPLLTGNAYLSGLTFALNGRGYLMPTANGTPPPPIPEPSTIVLLGCGLAGLLFFYRKRKKE